MATVAATITELRRILVDRPIRAKITVAISDTTTETFTLSAAHTQLFGVGEIWEHDDGFAERRYITDVDTATPLVTGLRGHDGSTAATHLISTYMVKDPRYPYNTLSQAIDECLSYDLWPHVYEIQTHEYTSSATSNAYNASSTSCEKILDVYQRPTSTDTPQRTGIRYTVYPQKVDTDLWANGLVFEIYGGKADGAEKYYVNCAHRLAIGTLLARQERMVQYCAAKYALEWGNPRRIAGPTNPGDRTVRVGAELQSAAYFADRFEKMKRNETKWLKGIVPRRNVFVRENVTYGTGF